MYPVNIVENLNGLSTQMFGISYDTYLKNIAGFDWFMMQEQSGSVAYATNSALALGRNLAINGDFANWTADDPDDWAVTEVGDATSNVTQNPAGECQIISDNTATQISQVILQLGKSYTATMEVNAVASGSIIWGDAGVAQQAISTTGAKTFSFTAANTSFIIKRGGVCNVTIDNVTVKQTNILASTSYPGAEELNEAGASGTATAANWIASASTLTNPVVGTLRVTSTGNPGDARQTTAEIGKRYHLVCQALTDGIGGNDWRVRNGTSVLQLGTNTSFVDVDVEFTATAADIRLESNDLGQYSEFRNISITEVNPMNGTYVGATLGNAADGKLGYAPSFDGTNDYLDIYSAELNSKLSPDAGTIVAFVKVANAGVWTDGAERVAISLYVDGSNFIVLERTITNNQLAALFKSGGTTETILISGLSYTGYFLAAMTWAQPGNLTFYINGVSVGTPQNIANPLVGNLLSTGTIIGALNTTPVFPWDGFITRGGFGWNTVLTPAQILDMYNRSGI